jgi:hypothetical protein
MGCVTEELSLSIPNSMGCVTEELSLSIPK